MTSSPDGGDGCVQRPIPYSPNESLTHIMDQDEIIVWVDLALLWGVSCAYYNPLTTEGIYILYVIDQIQVLVEFESSIFDEV